MTEEQKEFIECLDGKVVRDGFYEHIAYEIEDGFINIMGHKTLFEGVDQLHDTPNVVSIMGNIPSGVRFNNKGSVHIYVNSYDDISDDVIFDNEGNVTLAQLCLF